MNPRVASTQMKAAKKHPLVETSESRIERLRRPLKIGLQAEEKIMRRSVRAPACRSCSSFVAAIGISHGRSAGSRELPRGERNQSLPTEHPVPGTTYKGRSCPAKINNLCFLRANSIMGATIRPGSMCPPAKLNLFRKEFHLLSPPSIITHAALPPHPASTSRPPHTSSTQP